LIVLPKGDDNACYFKSTNGGNSVYSSSFTRALYVFSVDTLVHLKQPTV